MPGHFVGAWSVVIRTVIIDDYIRQAIAAGVDTVLNLGAGLDTRPYRIDLPRSLNWIEAKIGFWITDYFSPEAIRFGEKMRAAIRSLK